MSLHLIPSRGSSFFPGLPRWSDMERDMQRDISRMNRMFNDTAQHFLADEHGVHHRQPSHTYEENDQQAEIEVELPGVAKENVTIDFEADRLAISAKRYRTAQLETDPEVPVSTKTQQNGGKADTQQGGDAEMTQNDEEKQRTDSTEPRAFVEYQLNIPIGNKFDVDKITATMLGDGILTVVVPKKVEHAGASRMIEIGSA